MMSRIASKFAALGIPAIICLASAPALAGPTERLETHTIDWRVLFAEPEFNKPCPLTVYSEDLSVMAQARHAVLSPELEPIPAGRSAMTASEIIHDYARSQGFIGADNLGTYGDDLSREAP